MDWKKIRTTALAVLLCITMMPINVLADITDDWSDEYEEDFDIFYACGLEEHIHENECYFRELICDEGHSDDQHTAACFNNMFICDYEEHVHDEAKCSGMMLFSARYDDANGGSDYYNIISEKEWDIAPGVKETEIVMNNDAGTRRQVMHTAIVDLNNPYVKVMPGTKGMWPEEGNYGTQSTSVQALEAEKLGYGNVVVATNASLSWYTEAYYKTNPHLIGEPLGYSVLDGQFYTNSRMTLIETKDPTTGETVKKYDNGGGVQTITVINYDYHPITGEKRPDDMPKAWIRGATDPLTGWEEYAIPVLFTYLVKPDANGNPVNQYKEDHGSGIASRTFVGVTVEGELILAVSDGEQAPYSTGLTSYEMAEYMIKMGCVIAANCDGGGSTTFCSQRPGEDLKVNCSLSDGGERPTSNTFLVVSSAPADGVFARATISSDYNYYTPGSSVTFTALGTDAVGTKVDIPDDAVWTIKEEGMGTIDNDGVFTSNGTEGTVTVQLEYDGMVAGKRTIKIAVPDTLVFEQPIVTIPFGKTAKIPVKATANIDGVDFEIGLSENDVTFTTTNEALGTFDGLSFVAVDGDDVPADITSIVTATLNMGANPTATVQLNLGKASEVLWDFESGQSDIDAWNVINNRKNAEHWDYELALSLADKTNGQVHDGNYSMRLETNGLSSKASHSEQYAWIRLGVDGEAITLENAKRFGFWLYVPEDNIQCWVQLHYKTDSNGDGVFDTDNVVSVMESENVYYNIDESGWHYLSTDISAFTKVLLAADKQYDKDPSDGMTGAKGEFFLAIVFHKAINNKLWQINGSINGNYTYYLDNFTVDYSEAVEDRENPIFDKIYLDGTTALVKRDVITTASNTLNLSAAVKDKDFLLDADKNAYTIYNVSGLKPVTAKVYIDGVEVDSDYSNGVMSAAATVADGYHRVKFEICDNAGNKSVVIRVVKVESGNTSSTINVVPDDPTLDKIPFGSIYWMNLEATQIETIQSVETVIDLNNINHWQLDHMELAEGFTAEYTIAEETNTATITITRTGTNYDSGEAVLAKLPVRILYFDTDIQIPGYTAETYWTTYSFWAQDMKMDVDMGLITHTNGKTSTFSNEEFHVDTEMYTSMANMDKAYFAEHGTTHVHVPVELDDKAATCTEVGYTGRTFCEGCNSVVEWGTPVEVTGHTFEVSGDKLVCECSRESTATGLQEIDGKNYYAVNGKLTSGWITVDDDWYFFDTITYEGLDGDHYSDKAILFSYENGRLTDGTWAKTKNGTRYWYGPGYYRDMSPDTTSSRPYEIDGKTYLFDRNGYMKTGIARFYDATDGGGVLSTGAYTYYDCGEDGEATLLTGPYNGYYYLNGIQQKAYRLIQHTNGDYYFISDGHKMVKDTTVYLTSAYVNGHTYADGTELKVGYYTFDSEGKMVIKNGVYDGYMYINNERVNRYALIELDGDYYFVGDGRKVVVDQTIYLTADYVSGYTYEDGTPLAAGYYTFDAEGKMIIKHGVVDGYMYINGTRVNTYTLVEFEGDLYFVGDGRKVAVNQTLYLTASYVNGFTYEDGTPLTVGYYTFGEDGKMVINETTVKNGIIDGYMYINNERVNRYALIEYEGDFYFVGDGRKVVMDKTLYLTAEYLTGFTYEDGTPLAAGYYTFDDEGKMVIQNGIIDGYMYINNMRVNRYALIEYEGDFYFVGDGRKVVMEKTLYLTAEYLTGFTYEDGTPLAVGYYTFDDEGKMVIQNGIIDGYMYINNARVNRYALIEYEGDFYFVGDSRKVVMDKTLYLTAEYLAGFTYEDGTPMVAGYYTFDDEGKMVIKNGVIDGYMYINNEQINRYALIEYDGDFYYVGDYRKVVTNKRMWLTAADVAGKTFSDGTMLEVGYHYFGEDGKLVY